MTAPPIPTSAAESGSALPTGLRIVRQVAKPDTPWPGLMAHGERSGPVILVDVGELRGGWEWRAGPDGHLAGVQDLIRTPTGHLAVLPACIDPLDAFLARRVAGGPPLSAGEVVTLAVSVLRGAAESVVLTADAGGLVGRWWLTDDGRPLLAADGDESALDASIHALNVLRAPAAEAGTELAAAVEAGRTLLEDARGIGIGLPAVEDLLFRAAAPASLAPSGSTDVPVAFTTARGRVAVSSAEQEMPVTPRWHALLPHVDGTLADMASGALTAIWRRARRDRSGSRRRPVVVALAAAALVLSAGLLWPQQPGTAAGDAGVPTPASALPGSTAAASPRATPSATAAAMTAEQAGVDLLARRATCRDAACRAALQEDPTRRLSSGAIDLPADERIVSLLDDFGGAAVLRVHPPAGGTSDQWMVIVRTNGSWLLRDVQDVAQQP